MPLVILSGVESSLRGLSALSNDFLRPEGSRFPLELLYRAGEDRSAQVFAAVRGPSTPHPHSHPSGDATLDCITTLARRE